MACLTRSLGLLTAVVTSRARPKTSVKGSLLVNLDVQVDSFDDSGEDGFVSVQYICLFVCVLCTGASEPH